MQIEKMEQKHYDYLKKEFDVSEDAFNQMCQDRGKELNDLLDELTWKECDAADELSETGKYSEDGLCAIELIDIICGPYNGSEDDENE